VNKVGNKIELDEECLRNGVLRKIFVRKEGGCIDMFFVACAVHKMS
jgi:hypothetical protein